MVLELTPIPIHELPIPSFEIYANISRKIRLQSFCISIAPPALRTKLLFQLTWELVQWASNFFLSSLVQIKYLGTERQ